VKTHLIGALQPLDLQQLKRALAEAVRRYEVLFDFTPYPLIVFCQDSLQILAANERAVKHFGFDREVLLSMNLREVFSVEEVRKLFQTFRRAESGVYREDDWHLARGGDPPVTVDVSSDLIDLMGRRARLAALRS
jgi:PAS domain-containing protein